MRGKQLRKAVLLGMAMSMAVWTTGMAETNYPDGISGNGTFGEVNADVTVQADSSGIAVNNNGNTQMIEGDQVTISSAENVSLGTQGGVILVKGTGSTTVNAQNGIDVTFTGQGPNANNTAYGVLTNGLNAKTEFTTANGDVTIAGGSAETALVNTNFSALRGNVKITAENGDINLSSYIDDNNDSAYLRSTGIYAYGSTSNIELASQNLNITTDAQSGIASGLYSQTNNGRVDADIEKDITISANGEGAKGIDFSYGTNTISLQAGNDLSITATSENTVTTSDQDAWGDNYGAYGVQTEYNNMKLHAGNDLTISASAVDQNNAMGIWIKSQENKKYESGAVNEFSANGHVGISAALNITDFDKQQATAAGIYLQGDGAKPQDTSVSGNSISITAQGTSSLEKKMLQSYGIYATTTPITVETTEGEAVEGADPTIVIGAETTSSNASSGANGIYAYNSHENTVNKTTINNQNGATYIYGSSNDSEALGIGIYMTALNTSATTAADNIVDITSKMGTIVEGTESAVTMHEAQSQMTVTSSEGNNYYQSKQGTAVGVNNGADFSTEATGHMNSIYSEQGTGLIASNAATAKMLGDTNYVFGGQNGIKVSGKDSLVSMTGKNNIIKVSGETPASNTEINGIYVTDGGKYVIEKNDGNDTLVDVTGNEADKFTYGIRAEKGGIVDIDTNNFTLNTKFDGVFNGGNDVRGIYSEQSNVDIDAEGTVNITVTDINADTSSANVNGVYAETKDAGNNTYQDASATITADAISINASSTGSLASTAFGVQAKSVPSDAAKAEVALTATKGNIQIDAQSTGSAYGVNAADSAEINLMAENGNVIISAVGGDGTVSSGINAGSIDIADSEKDVAARVDLQGMNTSVSGTDDGILATYGKTFVDVEAVQGNNWIKAEGNGIRSENGADVQVTASQGYNIITALDETVGGTTGIYATNTTAGAMTSPQFTSGKYAKVSLEGQNNSISNFNYGIYEYANSDVQLKADENNVITAKNYGIYSTFTSMAALTAGQSNYVNAGNITNGFGDAYAVYAFDSGTFTGTTVDIAAGNTNQLLGAVYASGMDTTVQVSGLADENGNYGNSRYNYIGSAAAIANAGGLSSDPAFAGKEVISSIYAEHGAQISVSGDQNVIRTYADNTNENQLERAVWAYKTADISIDGQTAISTDRYETSPNSLDIAVAAGSATGLTEEEVNAPVADRAVVNINYNSYTDADGNTVQSSITGDILSAYAGEVNITPKSDTAQMHITGNILAGNNGVLNVNLGNGGTLTGRADDYGDAGVIADSGHGTSFFDPAFSSEILKGGVVNLTMGEGSRWNVTGQSWITTVDTMGSSNAIIDLVSSNTDRNSSAHALTIYDMKGDATFNMSLDADRSVSDMVYMKHADGSYLVNVIDPVTQQDIYANRADGGVFDGLRFATVGKGSHATFRAITIGAGVNNIEYEVGTDNYVGNEENQHYDSAIGGAGNTEKPGSDLVEGFFNNDGTPGVQTNGIMTMAARANENMGTDTGDNGTQVDDTTNFKLIGVKSTEISNAGKTVVAMSKVNYSNAVYMDRLNKRMGEARYIDGDEGLWVRMRHDRIGKSDAFRSKNTMFELGYDRKVGDREDGEHRQGVVFDYMRGTADYHNVAGEGDVRRGGVWFYDTWLGDKGHYTDYVLKFGRLSNDFEVYSELGEKITGDYSNFVYSASAEYGRKKSLGGDWYIEPQAQLQYAHVTDADYTTSQGTSVQLDAIDSLIGRVGFRLGKDVSDTSTFYIKADVLHEFLGDQDISAFDDTGRLDTTYENEGTWYDVGLGFSHQFSKGTYMFLDVEKTFGNDNEDTYQFNVGMNWKV